MKANKFFLGLALIGAILTGCENKEPEQTGVFDATSYMSVSIAQAGGTRATTDGGFIDGDGKESTIEVVDFYFYNTDGTAFNFNAANQGAGADPFTSNLYTYDPGNPGTTTDFVDDPNNIDEVLAATLVINHNKGNIPAYMIAVVNSATKYAGQSLSAVKTAVVSANGVNSDGTHIMTNSVYKNNGAVVMETPITYDNLAITADKAKLAPVKIYVERTAARVEVKEKDTSKGLVYNTGKTFEYVGDNTTVTVYAKITGWDIVTYANEGTLAKKIDVNWSETINGFQWNQPALYRSYWAIADKTTGTNLLTKTFTWGGLTNTVNSTIDYCLENTSLPEYNELLKQANDTYVEDKDISRTNVTKVVIAAQLCSDAAGTTPINIYNWYGSNYKTLGQLKTAVAQSLKNKLNYYDGATYQPIEAKHIDIVKNLGDVQHSYEVYFTLTTDASTPSKWYELKADNSYIEVTDPNKVLKDEVRNAKIWANGMTYYVVNIEHLGTTEKDGSNVYQPAYYGVVRNHAYEILFKEVSGFGTPVCDVDAVYPEPVTPDDVESYVAAEINILSWHVVKQDNVVLGQ